MGVVQYTLNLPDEDHKQLTFLLENQNPRQACFFFGGKDDVEKPKTLGNIAAFFGHYAQLKPQEQARLAKTSKALEKKRSRCGDGSGVIKASGAF